MKNPLSRKYAIIFVFILVTAIMVQSSMLSVVKADVQSFNDLTEQVAMAHWNIIDTAHGNVTIGMDAVYRHQTLDGVNISTSIYIKVTHVPQGVSEATGNLVNITAGPTWSFDHVFLNATLAFNWTSGGLQNHPITIEWFTAPQPLAYNSYVSINGSSANANGVWRSGATNIVNATMIIGGSGPHPGNFTSNWAMVGLSTRQPVSSIAASAFSSTTLLKGQTWGFFVQATGGVGPLSYQWYEGSTLISGQTSTVLSMSKGVAGTYTYTCKVTDATGAAANTNVITLNVI
jgi:hypothetical protein